MLLSLERVRDLGVALAAAVALALGFPKAGAAWLVPLGTAALFWAFSQGSWKRAAWLGWLSGTLFFCISFSWWTYTIGHVVGPFWSGAAVFICAAIDALAWAATGAFFAVTRVRASATAAAIAGPAAFTVFEWLRSIGPTGIPFAQLGYTQADTPLRVFAAYAGTYGVTFVLCAIGAVLALAIERRSVRIVGVLAGSLLVVWLACWGAWPARRLAPPAIPVAAVQGDIVQTLKWQPGSLALAVNRYESMTASIAPLHPKLVVWPETVIAIRGAGLNQDPALEAQFAALAARLHATLIAGSIEARGDSAYNALFLYGPGSARSIYEKRQLVPFAEDFPASQLLGWLPFVGTLNGGFTPGTVDGVYPTAAGLRVAPLICWESAFADRIHAQLARGAQLLVVSTDDAWFGTTSGPYQHAQISQLRAVESGTWVVRAAATGVSGIIAPDGRWTRRAPMDVRVAIAGFVGPPVPTLYARLGPSPVIAFFAVLAIVAAFVPRRGRA